MKKFYLKTMLAAALLSFGCMNMAAQEEEENDLPVLPVKMTYVDQSAPDAIVGEVDTIKVGYNKAPAVGGTIGFGNTGWGCNWIGYLQVDATAIPGIITKATLKAKISGSTDSKRNTGWGVALTDNQWTDQLNYATTGEWTVSALLNNGALVWNTQKSATVFEEVSFDVTEALSGADFTGFATIIVYETAAAGGYMTEATVEVEYDPYEATTTLFDFEDGVNIFTDDSRIASAIAADDVLGSNVTVFTAAHNCQNGYGFAHYDFTQLLNQPALVQVEFDYYNQAGARAILSIGDRQVRGNDGGCTKNTYGSKGAIFRIGSDKSNAFINNIILPQADVVTNDTLTVVSEEGDSIQVEIENTTPGLCNKWMHVVVIINNEAKTVTWLVTDMDGEAIHYGTGPFYSADANAASQIDVFAWINDAMSGKIDNLEITNYKSNAVFADYTVKYVDAEGTELKPSRAGNGQVGKFVTLLDSDKEPVYAADNSKKYLYDSDDSETTPIAEEGTVITVKFRDAEVYGAVLNCMIEGATGAAARLASFQGNFFEGDNYYVYPARGYSNEGKFYFTEATSWNGVTFTFPGSLNYRTVNGVKTYIGQLNYAAVDSVAYYSDFERLALPVEDEGNGTGLGQLEGSVNSWWSFSGGIFDRFSQGRGIRLDANSYVWTEPIAEAGTYLVTIYGRNDVSALCPKPYVLGLRDAEGNVQLFSEVVAPDWASATTGTNIVENVAIPAGSSLVIYNDGSEIVQDAGNKTKLISLDDISITKTGDYVAPALVSIEDYLIATGIAEVQPVRVNDGVIYNLNGQVVNSAQKGLYIQNGRIIVIK